MALPSEMMKSFETEIQQTESSTTDSSITPLNSLVFQVSFIDGDSTYTVTDQTLIKDRKLLLRDFEVTNGTDLYVYIVRIAKLENKAVKSAALRTILNLGK